MLRIKEITEAARLAPYRTVWQDLHDKTPAASFFLTLEWFESYWNYFSGTQRLRVLIVEEDGQITGILPLVVREERTRLGKFRILTYPLDNWGSFYSPIGPSPEKTLAAGLEHLRTAPRDWDYLELRGCGVIPSENTHILEAMQSAGMRAYPSLWGQTPLVDLSQGWESYQSTRNRNWWRRLRQAENKLCRNFPIEYLHHRSTDSSVGQSDPRWDLYDICEEIAEQSWQSQSTDGTTLCHPSVRPFLRELHALASARGIVDLHLLHLDGRPAAFIYGYHYRGVTYGLRRGFHPDFTRQGVGTILLAETLRTNAERGDLLYDLGSGSLESKRHFQTELRPILRYTYFPTLNLRTQILRWRRWRESRQIQVYW